MAEPFKSAENLTEALEQGRQIYLPQPRHLESSVIPGFCSKIDAPESRCERLRAHSVSPAEFGLVLDSLPWRPLVAERRAPCLLIGQ